jgi:CheY-like chemotaxis protein
MKVLYIDDEVDSAAMGSKIEVLALEGIEVIPVTEVGKALTTLRQMVHQVSVIVLDIIMPPHETYPLDRTSGGTTTGLTLLADIRKEFPRIPVVIVSVMPEEKAREAIALLNVSAYVRKPVDGTAISKVLRSVAR